jgi:plasmid stabilization system protein ParE
MIYRVLVDESVLDELNSAAEYFESKKEDLGIQFIHDWNSTLDNLSLNPMHYQVRFKQFRVALFTHFSYIIIYQVQDETIFVYRLVHAKRNPKKYLK